MAYVLPDILLRIELRALRRDRDDRDIVGDLELGRQVPAGLVHGHDGVRAGGNCAGDLCQMQLHSVGIAEGQDEACSVAFLMPYRAKNIG